jgi:hypothetical protein
MKTIKYVSICLLVCGLIVAWKPMRGLGQQSSHASKLRDGQHDFDFNVGKWQTYIRRLQHPLTGSTTWIELNGTVTVRKVWDGRAQLEEIEADGPAGHFEGLTLFLYNSQSHQWSQNFANSSDGTLTQPTIGEFKNGRGELYNRSPSTAEPSWCEGCGRTSNRIHTGSSSRIPMTEAKLGSPTSLGR